ncbi:MAG: glycoside hydrolase [Ruminococcaceae bacterium]|nr:glycoside hydrolase [Oscillospiraceae bacterium]
MRIIKADLTKEKGKLDRYFSECIGAGRAAEVMRYAASKQLEDIQNVCPFRYIRFHGLFHEEMAVVTRNEKGGLVFSFAYIDQLFDRLLELGLRPVVELSPMPDVMAKDKKYLMWWKMNVSMPKELSEWHELVATFVSHITARYGREEIKKWYFEVWNEPDHPAFFTEYEDITKYFELYDTAAFAVRSVDADYKVGGPATAAPDWLSAFIKHCKQKNVPLDFVSTHSYGVKGFFDDNGDKILSLLPVGDIVSAVKETGDLCKAYELPLFLTEWSSSFSPQDPVHDTYFGAVFILNTLKHCAESAQLMSYWTYTDIFEELGPPMTLFHGGFGILTVNGIKKPAFHAFRFLSLIFDTELECDDENAYVTESDGEIRALFWNIVQPPEKINDKEYFKKRLVPKKTEDAKLVLDGAENNVSYTVTVETLGYRSGDIYSEWLDMGIERIETKEQEARLKKASETKKTVFSASSDKDGKLEFRLEQYENTAYFVMIKRDK